MAIIIIIFVIVIVIDIPVVMVVQGVKFGITLSKLDGGLRNIVRYRRDPYIWNIVQPIVIMLETMALTYASLYASPHPYPQSFFLSFFLSFFWSGLRGPKSYSLWSGVVPSPSIGYDYL